LHVPTRNSAATGCREPACAVGAECVAVVIQRAEFGEIAVCLLEVIPVYLLVFGRALAIDIVSPLHELLVECRPGALEDSLVGSVANEDMMEPEGLVLRRASGIGLDELFAAERVELGQDALASRASDGARHP
jgi:hypothetical protein